MEPSYAAALAFVKRDYLFVSVSYRAVISIATASLLAVSVAAAQGLPAFMPLNPMAASRSGIYFQPYRPVSPGKWTAGISLDYGSAIERSFFSAADYTLDAEILRLDVSLGRDIGHRGFVLAEAEAGGAYAGFLDGFLDWYHRTLGFRVKQRDLRPSDQFLYEIILPDGSSRLRSPSDFFLGDLRFGAGYRFGHSLQSVLSITLPTSTAPAGYGRGVVSASILNTLRTRPAPRLTLEGALGLAYTPSHGDLESVQHETFVSASGGARYRFWGRQSLYANVFFHSPYYHDTALPALDRRELSLDFGWLLATHAGGDWRIGLTEDLEPGGPGIDLIFRLGREF